MARQVKKPPAGAEVFSAVDLFGDEATRVALDASGDGGSFDREIILTGDYKDRGFSVTRKHLDEIIANHKRSQVDPALDREHESWFSSEPSEARGWVKSLRVEPSKMRPGRDALVGTFEPTDLGRDAIAKKHFRYLSAGLLLKSRDRLTKEPMGAFLDHVALCKHPYVQGMQPLTLTVGDDDKETSMNKLLPVLLLSLGLAADADEDKALAAYQKREDERKALSERCAKLETDLAAARKDAGEVTALRASIKKLEDAALTAEVDAGVAALKITPAERDEWLGLAKESPDRFRKLLAARPAALSSEVKTADDAKAATLKLAARAAKQNKTIDEWLKANPGKSTGEAYAACAAADPDLFREGEE